jgi:biopolymer transport protein ExbD
MTDRLDFSPAQPSSPMGIQIAPLIDIVFLLICFFMFAMQLMQTQADASVQVPVMSSERADPQTPAEIIVNVRRDGTIRVNSAEVTPDGLTGLLAGEVARSTKRPIPLRVVIRADRRQHYDGLDKALNACRRAGITQIILRAEREEDR